MNLLAKTAAMATTAGKTKSENMTFPVSEAIARMVTVDSSHDYR
jgi:hypothetical protein